MAMQVYISSIGAAIGKKNGQALGRLLGTQTSGNDAAERLIKGVGNCDVGQTISELEFDPLILLICTPTFLPENPP
jgi:hypothetical protein